MALDSVALGECCEVIGGGTPKTADPGNWDGGIPWATPKDLSGLPSRFISETARTITEAGLQSSGARLLPKGSVLLSSRAPIGLVALNEVPLATNQGFKSLVPGESVDAAYLWHWLEANTAALQAMGNGATFKEISKRVVERVRIPLPELPEQKRLTEILDAAYLLREQARHSTRASRELTSSIFHDMFGDPGTSRRQWPLLALGELALRFSDGPFGSNLKSAHYTKGGVRVIRLQNIGIGELLDDDRAYVSESHAETLAKHQCTPGDVLIATLGDPNLRACVLPSAIEKAINKADCVQMRVDPTVATADYICALINDPGLLARARSLAGGQTRTRISMGRLRELAVPTPPLELQKVFSRHLATVRSCHETLKRRYTCQDTLLSSLRAAAFSGSLSQ